MMAMRECFSLGTASEALESEKQRLQPAHRGWETNERAKRCISLGQTGILRRNPWAIETLVTDGINTWTFSEVFFSFRSILAIEQQHFDLEQTFRLFDLLKAHRPDKSPSLSFTYFNSHMLVIQGTIERPRTDGKNYESKH